MPPCPTSSATQSTLSGFMLVVVVLLEPAFPDWFLYQQEVLNIHVMYTLLQCLLRHYCTTPAPPTPTEVTAQFTSISTVRVTWQWISSGSAPNCFNTTTVTYRPEGGGESSLQLRDPAATEATLTDLQCNTNYTVTAGEHRRERTVFFPLQGKVQH